MTGLRRRLRPRTLLAFLLLLVCGAIVNVAMAWGCVLTVDSSFVTIQLNPASEQIRWWRAHAPQGFDQAPERVLHPYRGFGIDSEMMYTQGRREMISISRQAIEFNQGCRYDRFAHINGRINLTLSTGCH